MYTLPSFCCAYFHGTVADSLNLIKPLGGGVVNYVGVYEEYPLFTVCCMMMVIVLCRSVFVLLCLLKYAKLSTSTLLAHKDWYPEDLSYFG